MSSIHNFEKPLVSVEWLKFYLHNTDVILLDATINKTITTKAERIPKARFFDIKKKFSDVNGVFPSTLPTKEQFETEARKLGIDQNSILIVYDDKGIYSSARAWWLFKVFGFNNVAVLNGGLPEWKSNGFKVEHYIPGEAYNIGNFKAMHNPDLMTNFDGINRFSNQSEVLILDARSEQRFKCLVDEPRNGLRRGTIPNSLNLPYTMLLNGNKIKPVAQLSRIFNNLVEDKTKLVFTCGSGITACILALAATLCNYKNLIVYDGSWTEYGTLTK